jgi:hypothetical protein
MKNDSEFIDAFKSDVIHNMTMSLARNGGVDPMINILAKNTVEKEFTVIIVPIPGDALKNVGNKEAFAEIIPMLFDEMFKNDLEPLCYSWSSEAWLRKGDKEEGIPEDWRELPKIEVLMTTFETKDSSIMDIHTIKREGKMADENGDLIDCISLEKDPELNMADGTVEGRFGSVFKTYMEKREENGKSNT